MIFRSLDANSDWNFGRGKNDYLQSDAAIGLNIKTRILSWLNDCFFDMEAGIDWKTRLGNYEQQDLLELDLRRIILQSYGVTGILSFDTNVADRAFSASYEITTINSQSYIDSITTGGFNG